MKTRKVRCLRCNQLYGVAENIEPSEFQHCLFCTVHLCENDPSLLPGDYTLDFKTGTIVSDSGPRAGEIVSVTYIASTHQETWFTKLLTVTNKIFPTFTKLFLRLYNR